MGVTKIVSDIKQIQNSSSRVYDFLSDFTKLGMLIEAAKNMAGEHADKMSEKIENIETTQDTCTFTVKGFGDSGLRIVEKEENKMIKIEGEGRLPFPVTLWIQLISKDVYDTRIRITLHAEMNMMYKMMLKGKLKKGVEQLADGLTKIPY